MAFQQGSFTGFDSLNSTIASFLTTNGWTQDGTVLYKNNTFIRLESSDESHLRIYGGTAQSGGILTNESSHYGSLRKSVIKSSGQSSMSNLTWPATYYMFAHSNPDFFTVVMNYDLLWIQWMTFGELEKYGPFTGGNYFGASYPSGIDTSSTYYEFHNSHANTNDHNSNYNGIGIGYWHGGYGDGTTSASNMGVYTDIDSAGWLQNGRSHNGYPGLGKTHVVNQVCGGALGHDLVTRNPNKWNAQTVLSPVYVTMNRPEDKISILGNTVHSRLTCIENHNIGDIITLGTDQWMVFPHLKKGTANLYSPTSTAEGNSGTLGFAIKYSV